MFSCLIIARHVFAMLRPLEAFEEIQSNPSNASVYNALLTYLNTLGEYSVERKKSSLHIVKQRAFLGVHPRVNGLLLTIVTAKPLHDALIKKTEQVSANRFHNEVLLADDKELSGSILQWIAEAYRL